MLITIRLLIPAWDNDPQYTVPLGENLSHVVNGKGIYGLSYFFWTIGVPWLRHFSIMHIRALTTVTSDILIILPLFALRSNAELFL